MMRTPIPRSYKNLVSPNMKSNFLYSRESLRKNNNLINEDLLFDISSIIIVLKALAEGFGTTIYYLVMGDKKKRGIGFLKRYSTD
jgi:hypothetical protein